LWTVLVWVWPLIGASLIIVALTLITRLSGSKPCLLRYVCTILASLVGNQCLISGVSRQHKMIACNISTDCKSPLSNHLWWNIPSLLQPLLIWNAICLAHNLGLLAISFSALNRLLVQPWSTLGLNLWSLRA